MIILDKAKMPDGTEIQLEDWSKNNTEEYPDLYGLMIGAYPIAKNSSRYYIIRRKEKFRLSIAHNHHAGYTNAMVKADYEALKNGERNLEDLADHFGNGKKDMYYLGIIDENPEFDGVRD